MPRRYKDREDRDGDHHGHGGRSARKKKKPKPEPPPAIPREETEEERRELMRRLRKKKKKPTEGAGLCLADRIKVQRKIEEHNRQIQEENANYNMSLGSLAVSELDAVDSRSRLEEVQEEGQGQESREALLTTVAEEDSVAPVIENNANGTLTPVESPEIQRGPDFAPMEPGYYDVTTGCATQMIDGTVQHVSNRRIRSSSTMRQRCVDLRKTKSSFGVTMVTPKEQTARFRMNEQTTFAGQGNNYQYRSYEEMYVLHPHQRPRTAVIPTRNNMLVRRIQSSKPNLASRELVVKSSSSTTVERGSSVAMVVSGSSVNSEKTVIIANQATKRINIDRSHYDDATESKCCDSIDSVAKTELVHVEEAGSRKDIVVITERDRSAENIVVVKAKRTEETVEKTVTTEENKVAEEVLVVTKEDDRVAKEVIVVAKEEDKVDEEVTVVTKEEDMAVKEVIVVAKEEDVVAKEAVITAKKEETTKSELNTEKTETDFNVKVVETNSTVVTETKRSEESEGNTKSVLEVDNTTDENIDLWIKGSEEKSKEVTEIKTEKSETEEMEKDIKDVDINLVADVERKVTVQSDVENEVTVETYVESATEKTEPQPEEAKDTEAGAELAKDATQEPANDEEESKDVETQSMSNSEVSLHLAVSLDGVDSPAAEPTLEHATPEPTVASEVEEMPKQDDPSKTEVPEEDVPTQEGTDDTKEDANEEAPKVEEVPVEEEAPKVEEEVPDEEEAPKVEEVPDEEEAPKVEEEVPDEEEAPKVEEVVPDEEEAPKVEEVVPDEEEAPKVEEVVPDEEETPKVEEVPDEEEAPKVEDFPIKEEEAKGDHSPEDVPKEYEASPSPVVDVEKPLTPKASPPRKRPSTSQPHGNKPHLDIPNKPSRHSSLDTRAMEKMIADMEKKVDEDLSSILNPPGAPEPIPAWEKEKNKETMRKLLNDEFFEEGDEDLLQGFIKDG